MFIPKNVEAIGSEAFALDKGLKSIRVDEANTHYDSRNDCNAIIETATNVLIAGCRNTVIPNGIVAIGDGAFFHCTELTALEMPETVTKLGASAFTNCWQLTYLDISHMVEIGEDCFNSCSRLKFGDLPEGLTIINDESFSALTEMVTARIPDKVTSVGRWAFFSNWYLTTVYIPESVEVLKQGAFAECRRLKDVYCYRKLLPNADYELFVTKYDSNSAKTDLSNATLHVPAESLEAYKTTKPWSDFGSIVPLSDGDTGISTTEGIDNDIVNYHSLDGKRLERPSKGLNIVRMADGQTKKIVVR